MIDRDQSGNIIIAVDYSICLPVLNTILARNGRSYDKKCLVHCVVCLVFRCFPPHVKSGKIEDRFVTLLSSEGNKCTLV